MDNSITFKLDREQLRLAIGVMHVFIEERPKGETQNLIHSILKVLLLRLRRRHCEVRKEYRLTITVYQAIALRRLVSAGITFYQDEEHRTEMRSLLSVIDPLVTSYITVS